MSTLSQFAPFAGGGLKSYQTGYVNSASLTTGTGEDLRYLDVTVSSVDTAKTMCSFAGSGSSSVSRAMAYFITGTEQQTIISPRMTSSTNLRLANTYNNAPSTAMVGRWQIAEAN
jgi:hypothetical protein